MAPMGNYCVSGSVYTDLAWAEDMATQGCDQSADPAAGMAWGGASRPLNSYSGAKAINPRGLGTESPCKTAYFVSEVRSDNLTSND